MNLKDIKEEKAIIKLNENNRKEFLSQAKGEGFKWSLSKDIQENDDCTFHIVLDLKLKIISNLSTMCYVKSKELQDLPIYEYKSSEEDLTL